MKGDIIVKYFEIQEFVVCCDDNHLILYVKKKTIFKLKVWRGLVQGVFFFF